jgi:hypothetical protein
MTNGTSLGGFDIDEGVHHQPERIFVYGGPGVGKTTYASGAPSPFFVDLDRGSMHVPVARNKAPIESWTDLVKLVRALVDRPHSFQTIVLDTADRAEWLCWQHVCQHVGTGPKNRKPVNTIEEVGGGYGKGYMESYQLMRGLWGLLEEANKKRGMRVIVLAHAKVETFKNPSGPDYDRYVPKVHKDVAKLFFETSDAAMYATRNVIVRANVFGNEKRHHAVGGEAHVLYTRESATHVAKNRYGLPEKIELDWDRFVEHVAKGHSPALLEATIRDKARRLGNSAISAVLDERLRDAKGDLRKMLSLMGKLDARLDKATEAKVAEEERQENAAAAMGGEAASGTNDETTTTTN